MKTFFSRTLCVASLCVGALLSAVAFAEVAPPTMPPPDRAQLEKRLESVKTLLEKSSAAKQIEATRLPAALAEKAKAMDLWQQAKQAIEKNDLATAQKLLNEAPKVMFAAARLAEPQQVTAEKVKNDYNNRRESVKALLSAQKRIADEKGNKDAAKATKEVEALLAEAEQQANAGRYDQARATVDKAYLVAKATVGSMREGDTLVRTLKFETKEEEYKYELDRNDTHLMLIKVLVEQQGKGNSMIDSLVGKAAATREKAEKAASGGDHQDGIKLLEESTSDLVRAIRSAGIYIPG
jgi:hypothetical protein